MLGNGYATIPYNGLQVVNGGIAVSNSGATVTGGIAMTGNMRLDAGAVSVLSSSATAAALDLYASSASFSGDVIIGRIANTPASAANALLLMKDTTPVFQVRLFML